MGAGWIKTAELKLDLGIFYKGGTVPRSPDSYIEASCAEIMPNIMKTPEDKEIIMTDMNSCFIFTSLTNEVKEMITEAMQLYLFHPGSIVFMQGMPPKSYYVVRTGSIDVIINGKKVNSISEGDGFGQLALLNDSPRPSTLKTVKETMLWGLDKETFKKIIEEMNIPFYEQIRAFLESEFINPIHFLNQPIKKSL